MSADTSSSSEPAMRRASAEIPSPSAMSSTSPGTSCVASIRRRRPSRRTVACEGRYDCSASTARSACCSWAKANRALTTITATIAMARTGVSVRPASSAAAHRSRASGWVNWRTSSFGQARRALALSSFGPDATRRRSASRCVSPSRRARRSRSSRSVGSRGSGDSADQRSGVFGDDRPIDTRDRTLATVHEELLARHLPCG